MLNKYLDLLQKIWPTRTRVVFFVMILTTIAALGFYGQNVEQGDRLTALFTVLRPTTVLIDSSVAPAPLINGKILAPEFGGLGEKDWDLTIKISSNNTAKQPEKPENKLQNEAPKRDMSLGEDKKKRRKKKTKKKIDKPDNEDNISTKSRELMEKCILAKDQQERARLRQSAMSISDMHRLASRNRESCSVVPRWPSPRDQEILDARKDILNAPVITRDAELYPPVFRYFSMFKRSYELMEKLLKVYIYKEGEKPIFHEPELTGIYSSEGWFMKHMQGTPRFLVNNPEDAHLFYMPFGSHRLQMQLYVPDSHSHDNLILFLQNYVSTIAAKYPFWNRTDGADHFLVSCHDWSTYETWRPMGTAVRALCNADTTEDFVVGKDVSLPETNVKSFQELMKKPGGLPPRKRTLLAFFAGQMHGYLRPTLVERWANDTDMAILGPVRRRGGPKKLDYAQYMKMSKFCVCPRGYEVNSPRVVEAIVNECVPVIISDNFVPPFFEVLEWQAFSVILSEKDVNRMKEILLSISSRKYAALRTGLKRVQRHFLWHTRPVKYDLFHMTLHSIWFNRVFQLRFNESLSSLE
ncbi:putative glycosyltransferase At3g07620 [Wolffia australiana]